MRLVDAEALLNEIQGRLSLARSLYHEVEEEGTEQERSEATGAIVAWREAGELVQAHLKAAPEAPQDAADQLTAAGAIIAALVRQLDGYGSISLYLPNIPPGQQSAATRMLAAAGLDCNGRRVAR